MFLIFFVFLQIVRYLMIVFHAAIICWSDSSSAVILGLSSNLIPLNCDHWLPEHSGEKADKFIFGDRVLEDMLIQLAPVSLMRLLAVKPWKQLTGRVWLFTVIINVLIVDWPTRYFWNSICIFSRVWLAVFLLCSCIVFSHVSGFVL